jgi:lysine 6-dehydrogenase
MGKPVFCVLGAGMQGTAAAYDLVRAGASEVRLVDRDPEIARAAAARIRSLTGGNAVAGEGRADLPHTLADALTGCDAALSAVPYFLNPGVAGACVEAGVSYCDLGGNTDVGRRVLAFDAEAKRKGIALVPDCGLAPGLSNTLAAAIVGRFDHVDEIRVLCGGLPQDPQPPFQYHLVFAMEGLLNEYDGSAEILRDGKRVYTPTLDEPVPVEFAGFGRLEACTTSGGTSTCPETWEGRMRTFEYKTLRYPGHWQHFRSYRDLGLLSEEPVGGFVPRQVLASLLRPRLTRKGAKDLVILRVEGKGVKDGKVVRGVFEMIDRFDEETGFSAMERTTAYPAAVVAWMLAAGETEKGGVKLEVGVPPERFLEHLQARDLPLTWSIS